MPSASGPARNTRLTDVVYATVFSGVAVAFMLLLLGSTSLMGSLTIIGLLLSLALVGGVLRFISQARSEREWSDQQRGVDRDLRVLHSRMGDHELSLMELSGRLGDMAIEIDRLRAEQTVQAERQRSFMTGMKDRLLKLTAALTRPRETQERRGTRPQSGFFSNTTNSANDLGTPRAQTPTSSYDEDVVVSPSLLREAVQSALREQRIDVYLQPVATLPQRRVYGYEVYGRLRLSPGVYLPASAWRGAAAHAGALAVLDRLVLTEAARQKTLTGPLFVNLSREGLVDRSTMVFLSQTLRATPDLAKRLIIGLTHRDVQRLDKNAEAILRALAHSGVRFSLNDIQGIDFDLNRLSTLGFTFVKLGHGRLFIGSDAVQSHTAVQRFVTRLQTRGMQLILAQVEGEEAVRQALDYPIALAQGYLFGRPDRPVAYPAKTRVA